MVTADNDGGLSPNPDSSLNHNKTNQPAETGNVTELDQSKGVDARSSATLADLQKRCDEYLQGWQRAKADYQNLQKEVNKEREFFAKFAKTGFLLQLAPVHNNLLMAFDHLPVGLRENEWVKGMEHVKGQMAGLLREMGAEQIKTQSERFDPVKHESVAQEKSADTETGVIIKEVSPGYMLDGEVLIPAKVVVAE